MTSSRSVGSSSPVPVLLTRLDTNRQILRSTEAEKSYLASLRRGRPPPHSVPGQQDKLDVDSYAGTADQLAAEWAGETLAAPRVA
jgi:hypothetical protein